MNTVLDDLMVKISIFLHWKMKNEWLYFDYGKIYVRKSKRLSEDKLIDCFDIATIELYEEFQGKGFFKLFLKKFIETYPDKNIYVESILNPNFYIYLMKFGFIKIGDEYSNNLILIK